MLPRESVWGGLVPLSVFSINTFYCNDRMRDPSIDAGGDQ